MAITLKQAQEAVGEGQDPNYWLEVLKANTVVKGKDMHPVAVKLGLKIGKKGNFEYKDGRTWSNLSYNGEFSLGDIYRLKSDYTFAPDCPKTVDCANYESSCEGECENFKPKGRTLLCALKDHCKYPFGSVMWIKEARCAKVKSTMGRDFALFGPNGGAVGAGYDWCGFNRFIYDHPTMTSLMESDITSIYKPE